MLELEIQFVVEELDGFAGPQVLEMDVATGQVDTVDAQREGLGLGVGRRRFTGGQLEQLGEVQGAVLAEQHRGFWLVQLHIGQVQGAGPETVDLQVGVQTLEADLLLAWLTDVQAPQGQLQAEGVELDALDTGRHRCVMGQLLIGDPQGDTRQNQKAQQAIEGQSSQQGADGANQSFGHVWLHLSESECLGVWHAILVPKQ